MYTVQSKEEYKSIVKCFKKRCSGVRSNCILLSSAMEEYILDRRLYRTEQDDFLAFYIDEGDYYRLYYYADQAAAVPDLRQDKPLILEETGSRGQNNMEVPDPWLTAGNFRYYRTDLQFLRSIQPDETLPGSEAERKLMESGIVIGLCTREEDRQKIISLWKESLEFGDLPEDHLRFDEDKNAKVYFAYDAAGEAAGAYWCRITGRDSCEGRHIVVSPKYFRRGIGTALVNRCIHELSQDGIGRISTWINAENTRSIRFHESLGFAVNGRSDIQYIL